MICNSCLMEGDSPSSHYKSDRVTYFLGTECVSISADVGILRTALTKARAFYISMAIKAQTCVAKSNAATEASTMARCLRRRSRSALAKSDRFILFTSHKRCCCVTY